MGSFPSISIVAPGKGAKPVAPAAPAPTSIPGPAVSSPVVQQKKESNAIPFNVFADPLFEDWLDKIVRPADVLAKRAKNETTTNSFSTVKINSMFNYGLTSSSNSNSSSSGSSTLNIESGSSKVKADASEPSIIFATITNNSSSGGLIAMHMNSRVTQAVTGSQDSCVRVWRLGDPSPGSPPASEWFQTDTNNQTEHDSFEFSEVFPGSKEGNILSKKLSSKARRSQNSATADLELRGHRMSVFGVSQLSSSDRLVLSSSADESIRLWDLKVRQCVGKYCCLSIPWTVQFSPIGYYFASGNADRTGVVYSTDRVSPIRLLVGHISDVTCLDWHGNAVLLSTGSDDRSVRLWDIRTAESVRIFAGSTSSIHSVSVSPSGKLIAGGADNGKVYIWDVVSGRELCILQGHDGPVHSVAFSDEGNSSGKDSSSAVLMSGGADSSVRIWKIDDVIDDFLNGKLDKETQAVLAPRHSYFTKYCPVYCVGFTDQNLAYAGGSFCMSKATGN